MYRVSPYTYLIEGVLGQAIGNQEITCAQKELATLTPPSGRSCGDYLAQYISVAGGYVANPNATSDCQFCSTRTTNQFLEVSSATYCTSSSNLIRSISLQGNFNIFYSHRWRDFGLMVVYCAFNIAAIYFLTWFFRIRKGSLLGSLKSRLSRKQ
jgi:ATP-binding cassette, subfamily G (WHITE), member 2, SNQ2